MVIGETTVRPMDGAVEHPRMDWLRVVEPIPWLASLRGVSLSQYHGWSHSHGKYISSMKGVRLFQMILG